MGGDWVSTGGGNRAYEAADLAREVSAILGREVSGTLTPRGGISLRCGKHQLYISPDNVTGNEACPRACAAVFELGDCYDRVLEEETPAELTRLVERLK